MSNTFSLFFFFLSEDVYFVHSTATGERKWENINRTTGNLGKQTKSLCGTSQESKNRTDRPAHIKQPAPNTLLLVTEITYIPIFPIRLLVCTIFTSCANMFSKKKNTFSVQMCVVLSNYRVQNKKKVEKQIPETIILFFSALKCVIL